MKPIHSVALAVSGSLFVLANRFDPGVNIEFIVGALLGIWWFLAAQLIFQAFINRKPSNEKAPPVTPSL